MSEYRIEFDKNYTIDRNSVDSLQHYRIQIRKLEEKNKQIIKEYERRLAEMQKQSKGLRKPIFQKAGNIPNLNYQLYIKDEEIKQLKNQNGKLRRLINNPDQVLIKKSDTFDEILKKNDQIGRLKKALVDLESKYDGKYFTEHKLKKEYDMLVRQNEELKSHIKGVQQKRGEKKEQVVGMEFLQGIKLKKELEMLYKQNETLKKALASREEELNVKNVKVGRNSLKNRSQLGINTQLQDLKLEVQQFKQKNRQLQDRVVFLEKQNDKLQSENERARQAFQNRSEKPGQASRVSQRKLVETNEQDLVNFYEGRKSRMEKGPDPQQIIQTAKKSGRYDQFNLNEYQERRKPLQSV